MVQNWILLKLKGPQGTLDILQSAQEILNVGVDHKGSKVSAKLLLASGQVARHNYVKQCLLTFGPILFPVAKHSGFRSAGIRAFLYTIPK